MASICGWTCRRHPAVVFNGGPVQFDALIAIAELRGPREDAWSPILADLGSVDLARDSDRRGRRSRAACAMFRGYAGWAPGQLDSELAAGAWMVFDAQRDDVFTAMPEDLWR